MNGDVQKDGEPLDTRPPVPSSGWLNRTVIGIGLASLCSDIGHEMATTAMPALLASVGASAAVLGLIEGLADGVSSFAKLLSGLYSDRLRRRKPLAVVGYFVTASGMAGFALATHWWHVLLGRVFGWLGRGARTPVRNVLLAEATTPATYGRAFGLERAMDSAGAVVGPALALLLVATVGLRWTFALTLVPGLAAALLIAFAVREKEHPPQPHVRLWGGMKALPGDFRLFLVGVGVAGLGDFSNTLLILWATEAFSVRYGLGQAATLAMLFYVGYNVVYTASCYVSGSLADRLPKKWVLAAGYALAVIPALALLVPGDSFWKFGVVFGVSGLYMGVWETVESSTAATLLPADLRGVGFGTLATVNGAGDLISSALVGLLWVVSPTWAMSYVIATSLAGAAVIASTHPSVTAQDVNP
jgi:MFS family permease